MSKKQTAPVKSSTQNFVEIEAIKDDILMLRDYSCCVIIESGTVNFGLLAEDEQRAMIYSYAQLLNSLSFAIQIVVLSKRMDISSYLDYLDEKILNQQDEILRNGLVDYTEFIKGIITKNTILEKNFYFIVPFSPLEMGIHASKKGSVKKDYVFTRAKTSLYPKKDHLMRLLRKAGLGGRVLYEQDIAELYYNLYNPSSTGQKLAPVKNYTDIILTP
ncbi:hypothetical protein A3H80_04135 [Candidatus Roizmanbacteria bacterium RIFCSPLOWO2_02_FULL_37_19]|uniref:Uncharacterized protein n=1 Tax=Candidatus Roizmanbacteria bacterium RIFCSPHIGHO2_02_FULL_37_24 TaxID=1802037 RepID=A0A1F7GYL0_9BACT|nr:MAG: hypothetical protein A3C24_04135 [Candidatus Roizmanbacteria bacterium RIFCSPHIGHO2_02_FULL_37_24]OGK32590.1 MAG: hypothetical protein A3E10_02655 [Candidatus Roizmanbacteria bacterium RIFCSPHIGHO2_12_FULL_37_23]OGK44339.1 MAG: hypothetical protein A2956_04115 [Candidatus Roizmanbacteria bacterium RIFCSPLOWO2_01_FULL_37_57]OGK53721.1 MAG: hypothetical protein A3H80_04135 [Candidatus Roizmanbacteria bacterium RIFCSPLOWO2_02_FULL_37_19]OGK59479.1 MAG: hypothetical protein A3G65_04640 [Can